MLNYIWAFMILVGVVYGVCTGQVDRITVGAREGAGDVCVCVFPWRESWRCGWESWRLPNRRD